MSAAQTRLILPVRQAMHVLAPRATAPATVDNISALTSMYFMSWTLNMSRYSLTESDP